MEKRMGVQYSALVKSMWGTRSTLTEAMNIDPEMSGSPACVRRYETDVSRRSVDSGSTPAGGQWRVRSGLLVVAWVAVTVTVIGASASGSGMIVKSWSALAMAATGP